MFSDKSQTSLKADSLTIYPPRMTFASFLEWLRRFHVPEGSVIVAKLPLWFGHVDEEGNIIGLSGKYRRKMPRRHFPQDLHKVFKILMTTLLQCALSAFSVMSSNLHRFRIHVLFVLCIGGTPECERWCIHAVPLSQMSCLEGRPCEWYGYSPSSSWASWFALKERHWQSGSRENAGAQITTWRLPYAG